MQGSKYYPEVQIPSSCVRIVPFLKGQRSKHPFDEFGKFTSQLFTHKKLPAYKSLVDSVNPDFPNKKMAVTKIIKDAHVDTRLPCLGLTNRDICALFESYQKFTREFPALMPKEIIPKSSEEKKLEFFNS